jgi:uncharacterized protein YkwD
MSASSVSARPRRSRMTVSVLGIALLAVAAAGCLPAEERSFLERTNALRTAHGLPVLADHDVLNEKAEAWAQHMAKTGHLDHSNLTESLGGLQWSKLAENVGMSEPTADTYATLHESLAASGSHLANLLDPQFDHMGVGLAESADGRVWVVEVFADL